MILDNLSIVGLFIASPFLLLPLLFGKERRPGAMQRPHPNSRPWPVR